MLRCRQTDKRLTPAGYDKLFMTSLSRPANNLRNGGGEWLMPSARQTSYIDTAITNDIHRMLIAQRINLLRAQPKPREHTAVTRDEIKIVGVALLTQRICQIGSGFQHGMAHFGQFIEPVGAQIRR
jgi:hypothetical protein